MGAGVDIGKSVSRSFVVLCVYLTFVATSLGGRRRPSGSFGKKTLRHRNSLERDRLLH